MELPLESVTRRARGSRLSKLLLILILYSWLARAPGISADHVPLPSFTRGVVAQPLNWPFTPTADALGAQTRNMVPVPSASA